MYDQSKSRPLSCRSSRTCHTIHFRSSHSVNKVVQGGVYNVLFTIQHLQAFVAQIDNNFSIVAISEAKHRRDGALKNSLPSIWSCCKTAKRKQQWKEDGNQSLDTIRTFCSLSTQK